MPIRADDRLIEHLRQLVLFGHDSTFSDGDLLIRFVKRRDDAAFEALVRRHGPMVFGVCNRVLRHRQDAEDALQATFLVLARKASRIAPPEMVGNWLYGVAHQTAIRVRTSIGKRNQREQHVPVMPETPTLMAERHDDLWRLIDQEVNRLPDKYRAPIVLCDLEGKTRQEAALHLGWPEGSVAGRLARGRKMLAERLAKHGPTLSIGALAAELAQNAASACLPISLVSSIVAAAGMMAAGQTVATGLISAEVAAITEGVLKAMLLTKLRIAATIVTMMLTCSGICLFGLSLTAAGQNLPIPATPPGDKDANPPAKLREKDAGTKPVELTIRDVQRGLEHLDRIVSSYSVEVEYKNKTNIERSGNVIYKSDKGGRVVFTGTECWSENGKSFEESIRGIFDGTVTKTLKRWPNWPNTFFGRIEKGDISYHGGVRPREYLTYKNNVPIRIDADGRIVGKQKMDGRDVVVIESMGFQDEYRELADVFFLDVDRNFAIVKSTTCYRFRPSKDWIEYSRIHVLESSRDPSGAWLPTRVVRESFDLPSSGANPVKPSPLPWARSEITLKNWIIKPDLQESLFSLTFEPGTDVQDQVTGRTYRVQPPPPTAAQIRKAAFDRKDLPLERFAAAKNDARLSRQHILLIFAPSDNEMTDRLLALIKDRSQIGDTMDEFRTLWIATDGDCQPAAQALAKELRYDLQAYVGPVLVVADEVGQTIAVQEANTLQKDGALQAALVTRLLQDKVPKKLDAEKLLADALALAKKENKRVIVQETATWCPPCWQLSHFLDAHRDIWEKDYIWIKLDQRWTKATDIADRLRNGAKGGIPWIAILAVDGKVLATSNDPEGNNIGFPTRDELSGIAHFTTIFRTTARRLTAADITRLTDALKTNTTAGP